MISNDCNWSQINTIEIQFISSDHNWNTIDYITTDCNLLQFIAHIIFLIAYDQKYSGPDQYVIKTILMIHGIVCTMHLDLEWDWHHTYFERTCISEFQMLKQHIRVYFSLFLYLLLPSCFTHHGEESLPWCHIYYGAAPLHLNLISKLNKNQSDWNC